MNIENTVASALRGERRRPRYAVEGVNSRGESFRIERYFTRQDAADFAAEVMANGGTASVQVVPA